MEIDIVIPSFLSREKCQPLLDAIAKTRRTTGQLIHTGLEQSSAVNRNAGLDRAATQLVIMLDDDIDGASLVDGWDEMLVAPFATDSRIRFVSARLLNTNGSLGANTSDNYNVSKDVVDTYRIPTACMAMMRTELRFFVGFIGSGWEDTDIQEQYRRKYPGSRVVINNKVRVVHRNEAKNQGGHFWQHNAQVFRQRWRHL